MFPKFFDDGREVLDEPRIERHPEATDGGLRFGASARPERLRERRISLRRVRASYPERGGRVAVR